MVTLHEIASGNGLLAECLGVVTAKQVADARNELRERPAAFRRIYFVMADLTNCAQFVADAEDVNNLASQDLQLARIGRQGLPVAVIAKEDSTFGLARMWQTVAEPAGWTSRVVRSRPAAESWLREQVRATFGVELPAFELGGKDEVVATSGQ